MREVITLYYVHDPMCSWCWAFRPVWQTLKEQLPESLNVIYLLGGLAPDSKLPMQSEMQQHIQNHWRTIQKRVPATPFNFEFWQACIPRRSTYPACRAVIAAKQQDALKEDAMILAIQQAYYLQACNPSDDDVLSACAESTGLDPDRFKDALNSDETHMQLMQEIELSRSIGASGFPSLIVEKAGSFHPIQLDYLGAEIMLNQIRDLLPD